MLLMLAHAIPANADLFGLKNYVLKSAEAREFPLFEVTDPGYYVIYFAAEYDTKIQLLFPSNYLGFSRNYDGDGVSGEGKFNRTFGWKVMYLIRGTWSLAVLNLSSASNTISVEIEKWPLQSGSEYLNNYLSMVTHVQPGKKSLQRLTIESAYDYVIEGTNTGLDFHLIPASAVDDYNEGRAFSYYPEYSSHNDPNQPGFYMLKLPPGDYYLTFNNPDTRYQKALVYSVMRYAPDGNGSGVYSRLATTPPPAEASIETGSVDFAVNAGIHGNLYLETTLISQSPSVILRVNRVTDWSGISSAIGTYSNGVITIPHLSVRGSGLSFSNVRLQLAEQNGLYTLTLLGLD